MYPVSEGIWIYNHWFDMTQIVHSTSKVVFVKFWKDIEFKTNCLSKHKTVFLMGPYYYSDVNLYILEKAIFIEKIVKTSLVNGHYIRIIRHLSYCKDFEWPPIFGFVFQNGRTWKTFVLNHFVSSFDWNLPCCSEKKFKIKTTTEAGQIMNRKAYIFICMCMYVAPCSCELKSLKKKKICINIKHHWYSNTIY